jgi:hypothetical protein
MHDFSTDSGGPLLPLFSFLLLPAGTDFLFQLEDIIGRRIVQLFHQTNTGIFHHTNTLESRKCNFITPTLWKAESATLAVFLLFLEHLTLPLYSGKSYQ